MFLKKFSRKKSILVLPRADGLYNQLQDVYRALSICQEYGFNLICPDLYDFVQYGRSRDQVYRFKELFSLDPHGIRFKLISMPRALGNNILSKNKYISSVGSFARLKEEETHKLSIRYDLPARVDEKLETSSLEDAVKKTHSALNEIVLWDRGLLDQVDFGIYSDYRVGQGWNVNSSFRYKQVFPLLVPSRAVLKVYKKVRISLGRYNAIHLRRGDYNEKLSQIGQQPYADSTLQDTFGSSSFWQQTDYIFDVLGRYFDSQYPVLLATEEPAKVKDIFKESKYKLFVASEHRALRHNKIHDFIGLVEILLAAESEVFIANRYSSFSSAITNMRRLRQKESRYW